MSIQRSFALLAVATFATCLSGCRHTPQTVQAATAPAISAKPTAPPIQIPPASVLKNQADSMSQVQAEIPPPEPKPEEQPRTQRPERRRTQPQPAKPTTPPVQTASAAPTAEEVIGQLSTGGDASTQSRKQTEDLINGLQKRLDGLPGNIAQSSRSSLDQIRDFLRKATEAMRSGDLDGANNLANKAKLLLDDIKN